MFGFLSFLILSVLTITFPFSPNHRTKQIKLNKMPHEKLNTLLIKQMFINTVLISCKKNLTSYILENKWMKKYSVRII